MKIAIELTERNAKEFFEKCLMDGTTPAEVLGGFVADLIDGDGTRGSDERRLASEYYERCGYYTGKETFPRFLLSHYGREALEEVYQEEEGNAAREYYEVYTEWNENPESLEDATKAVIDFMEQGAE